MLYKAIEAIERLRAEKPSSSSGEVVFLQLDLADPRNAKKAASEFLAKEKRLDILSKLELGDVFGASNVLMDFLLVNNAARSVSYL